MTVNHNTGEVKCFNCTFKSVTGCAHEYIVYILRERGAVGIEHSVQDFKVEFCKSMAEYKSLKLDLLMC